MDSKDEKVPPADSQSVEKSEPEVHRDWRHRLLEWSVEARGIRPVSFEERTDPQYSKIFFIWFSASINLLPFSTGSLGPIAYGLSVRDSCLIILFFNLICCLPPGYLSTWGPKLGLRQMVQARYSFGYFGVIAPVLLNLMGMTGFCILDCILGGQTLAAVADGNLSWSIGIVIIAVVSLLISFCGWRILHWIILGMNGVAWIPIVIIFLIAVGLGGKDFQHVPPGEPATAPTILSFAAVIAGFVLTWSPPRVRFYKRIFLYSYFGLVLPTVAMQCFGALIGACLVSVPAWEAGNDSGGVGGVLDAMLSPAKGFGKFLTVLLALSVTGNVAATLYSISLNLQLLMPVLVVVPRYVFPILATAIAFIAIVLEEHFLFRKGDAALYNLADWNTPSKLPSGAAAILAGMCGIGIAIPSMAQVWYTGPIAETTGDIGFELAFVVTMVVYPPLRLLERRVRNNRV
ncbi:NCS cytosine-purine permease [Mycena venus]|uniref:NCS cytosine-purine permease n=1 Tax=Mycena venus TaxID=2733690 RepID=A0A8H6YJY1_9AGAR|nr:NCS cytosine-purine permease [Mycena venus]